MIPWGLLWVYLRHLPTIVVHTALYYLKYPYFALRLSKDAYVQDVPSLNKHLEALERISNELAIEQTQTMVKKMISDGLRMRK